MTKSGTPRTSYNHNIHTLSDDHEARYSNLALHEKSVYNRIVGFTQTSKILLEHSDIYVVSRCKDAEYLENRVCRRVVV